MAHRSSRRGRARRRQRWVIPAAVALLAVVALVVWLATLIGSDGGRPLAGADAPTPTEPPPIAVETVTSEPGSGATPEPEPTVTTEPEPTPTPTAPPTVVPTVVIGEFGDLPPPNIPQARPDLARLRVQYDFALDLDEVPTEAPVYRLVPRTWDEAQVAELASALGIDAEVVASPTGFAVGDDERHLFVSGNQIQYELLAPPPPNGEMPDDETLVAAARDWLVSYGLVTEHLGDGAVSDRVEESGLAIVVFRPAEPRPILSAVPRATVAVHAGGTVVQAFISWPAGYETSIYSLRTAPALVQDVVQGRGYVDVPLDSLPAGSNPVPATVTIDGVEIVYTDAGSGERRYLTPLVRFTGRAVIEGVADPVPFSVSVPAVVAQELPRG